MAHGVLKTIPRVLVGITIRLLLMIFRRSSCIFEPIAGNMPRRLLAVTSLGTKRRKSEQPVNNTLT